MTAGQDLLPNSPPPHFWSYVIIQYLYSRVFIHAELISVLIFPISNKFCIIFVYFGDFIY